MGSGATDHLTLILSAAIPFVEARRKPSGGFGATPKLPTTIEDTYHALNVFGLIRQHGGAVEKKFDPFADENLRSYLDGCRRTLSVGIKTTFQMLWCCRTAGVAFDPDAVEEAVINSIRAYPSLEGWYYYARIMAEVLERKPLMAAEEPSLKAVLDHDFLGVDEAWVQMYLYRMFRHTLPQDGPKLISWFQASQNGDGGFGFFPGTTSFVENCHYCLRALSTLGTGPTELEKARRFLTACQTASGGFGRGLRAAPFLDATWHGVAALAFLG